MTTVNSQANTSAMISEHLPILRCKAPVAKLLGALRETSMKCDDEKLHNERVEDLKAGEKGMAGSAWKRLR